MYKKNIISFSKKISDAIEKLNISTIKTLVVLKGKKFIGTVTDGDIRRGLIKKISLNESILKITNTSSIITKEKKIKEKIKEKIIDKKIDCLPIVSNNKTYLGFHTNTDDNRKSNDDALFIIMAGGRGRRLMPITETIPKPMVIINRKPMIEHIVRKIYKYKFKKILITTFYKSKIIIDHLKKIKNFKNKLNFFVEKKPLGTAGSLSMIKGIKSKICVITNSDIMTDFKYSDILEYHKLNNADLTISTYIKKVSSFYGNLFLKGKNIKKIKEKPSYVQNISIGIYVINTELFKCLKKNKYCDMPEFINILIKKNKKVLSFPMHENWIDVGNLINLKLARKRYK